MKSNVSIKTDIMETSTKKIKTDILWAVLFLALVASVVLNILQTTKIDCLIEQIDSLETQQSAIIAGMNEEG